MTTTLLDRPFVQGSSTSFAASCAAKDLAVDTRARVFAHIHSKGVNGATRQEIQDALGISGDTCRPRCAELIIRDLIRPSGEIRRSASGRACEVLCAREFVV